jgi:hypothetical protein
MWSQIWRGVDEWVVQSDSAAESYRRRERGPVFSWLCGGGMAVLKMACIFSRLCGGCMAVLKMPSPGWRLH